MKINKKDIVTIKYPLRYSEQIILLVLVFYYIFSGDIFNNDSTNNLIFIGICLLELFSIIYILRNKTYYYVDKANYKYLIKRKDLNSKEEKEDSESFVIDHYRYNDKDIDVLNGIDLLFSLPSNDIINRRIKEKVLNYSKYQIESINMRFSFIGIKCYYLVFKNNKCKNIITFNNLI